MKQKTPLRLYVGITPQKEDDIVFNNIQYYSPHQKQYLPDSLLNHAMYVERMQTWLKQQYQNTGCQINFLAETDRMVGLDFEAVMCLLLCAGLMVCQRKLTVQQLQENQELTIPQLMKVEESSIQELITQANNLYQTVFGHCVELALWTSLLDGQYPTIQGFDNFNQVSNTIFRLNELDNHLPTSPFVPVDFLLIYS